MGKYAFAPLAASVTSGARLILAMVEVELRDRRATYAFCDTDSAAMVAPQEVVRAMRVRFRALTPYAFGGDLLKLEAENQPVPEATRDRNLYFYGISAKRYVLFNVADNGKIIVRKGSEHGLGYLMGPEPGRGRGWTDDGWRAILEWMRRGGELGRGLVFADRPAVGKAPITKPKILDLFRHVKPRGRPSSTVPHTQKVKPFNFLLVAFPESDDITTGGEAYWPPEQLQAKDSWRKEPRKPIRPVAPYELDPGKWAGLAWVDLHTGRPIRLSWNKTAAGLITGTTRVRNYAEVLSRHVTHPEAKAAGPDGEQCGPHTSGELTRLQVHVRGVVHIGKESHDLEEVQDGLTPAISTYVHYRDRQAELDQLRRVLRPFPRKKLAELSGLHLRSIKELLNTHRVPHRRNLVKLIDVARQLTSDGAQGSRHRPGDES